MSEITKKPDWNSYQPLPRAEILYYGHCVVPSSWNYVRNMPFWFLYCNPTAGGRLIFADGEISPGPEDLLLIPPHTPFRTLGGESFEQLYVHFSIGRPYSQVRPGVIRLAAAPFRTLIECVRSEAVPGSYTAVSALVYAALSEIPAERFTDSDSRVDDRIQRALSLLNSGAGNLALSRTIGMSASHFQRCFKREMGVSPRHYAMVVRLERAKTELNAGIGIDDAARHCGFADRYAFSKAFKKYTGVTPGKYRRGAGETEK